MRTDRQRTDANGRTFVSDGAVLAVAARTAVDIPAPFTPITLGTVFTPVAATTAEAISAHPSATPQALTAPAIVDGTFTAAGEDDSYSVVVPGGSSVELTVLAFAQLQYSLGTAGNAPPLAPLGMEA